MRTQTKLLLAGCGLTTLLWFASAWGPMLSPTTIAPAGATASERPATAETLTTLDDGAGPAAADAPARTPVTEDATASPSDDQPAAEDQTPLRVVHVVDARGRSVAAAAVSRVDRSAPAPIEAAIQVGPDGSFDLGQLLGIADARAREVRTSIDLRGALESSAHRASPSGLQWGAGVRGGDVQSRLFLSFSGFPPIDDGKPPRLLPLGVTDASGRCRVRLADDAVILATTKAEWASGLVEANDGDAQADGEIVLVVHPPCVVRGVVVDAAGRALAGAMVAARAFGTRGTAHGRSVADVATDAGGAFALTLDAVATYDIQATHGEHASETLRLDARATTAESVRLRMLDALELRGDVHTAAGAPAAKASVQVHRADADAGADRFVTPFEATATADEDGTFRVSVPGAGRYLVTASLDAHAPSVPTLVAATASGTPDLHLHLRAWTPMTGTVRWDDGTPIAGATLTAHPEPGQPDANVTPGSVETDADGRFEFWALGHVRYEVVCVPVAAAEARERRVGITPSPQEFVFDRASIQGVSVRIRLVVPEGQRQESATAIVSQKLASGWVRGREREITFDAEHVGTVAHLKQGETYAVELRGGFSRCRTTPFVAGVDAERTLVAKAPGQVTVQVFEADGSPAFGATAILREDAPDGLRRDDATKTTGLDGRAHWESVSALPWLVLAARDGREGAFVRLQVEPDGEHRVEVRLR